MKSFLKKLKAIVLMFTSAEGTLFTYSFAYAFLLGMAPLIMVIILFVSKYVVEASQISEFLSMLLPEEYSVTFVNFLKGVSFDNIIASLILLGVCIFVASNSIYSLMLFDQQRHPQKMNTLLLRLLAIANLVILIAVSSVTVAFTDFINGLFIHVNYLTQVLTLLVVFLVFYRLLSISNSSFRKVYKGAVFAALAMSLMGILFFKIINTFTNYDTIYGPLASIMVLLLSCYVVSCIVYLGYCINIVLEAEGETNETQIEQGHKGV